MTPEHIALVQRTFADVLPLADTAAALFYERLFTLDPALRVLFHSDMQEQGRKLMTVLQLAVAGLSRLEALLPMVQQLSVRHRSYGVKDAHYATVGAACTSKFEMSTPCTTVNVPPRFGLAPKATPARVSPPPTTITKHSTSMQLRFMLAPPQSPARPVPAGT